MIPIPELPDLEVFRVNIFRKLTAKHLLGVEVCNSLKVNVPAGESLDELGGMELAAIDRSGKELLFRFKGDRVIAVHLMLSGEISMLPRERVESVGFKIFAMHFARESLVFSDRGGLCTVRYMPQTDAVPDALGEDFTLGYFKKAAAAKARTNVKAFLIDQKIVKGIGNAYADEILWRARISPRSVVGKIPEEKLCELYFSVGTVLSEAVASIKAMAPDIISGEVRSFLRVHNKALRTTETGYPITVEKIASKITYYTKEQVLYF